jgi:hypothetical protein
MGASFLYVQQQSTYKANRSALLFEFLRQNLTRPINCDFLHTKTNMGEQGEGTLLSFCPFYFKFHDERFKRMKLYKFNYSID